MFKTQNSKYTRLTIASSSPKSADYVGSWEKSDIVSDIKDICGRRPKNDTEWISWILDHNFGDLEQFTEAHHNMIADPSVVSLTIELDNGLVFIITKEVR